MHNTRISLLEIGIDSERPSYYDVIAEDLRDNIDIILDRFVSLESQEKEFWNEYQLTINKKLEEELEPRPSSNRYEMTEKCSCVEMVGAPQTLNIWRPNWSAGFRWTGRRFQRLLFPQTRH